MDEIVLFIAFLIVYAVALIALANWTGRPRKKFPWCRRCYVQMYRTALVQGSVPDEVISYLGTHNLPYSVVSRYVCPRGHTQMWHIPRLGNAERGIMIVRDM